MRQDSNQLELFPDSQNFKYTIGRKCENKVVSKVCPADKMSKMIAGIRELLNNAGIVGPIAIEINCRSYRHTPKQAHQICQSLFPHKSVSMTSEYMLRKGRGSATIWGSAEFFQFQIHYTDPRFVIGVDLKGV